MGWDRGVLRCTHFRPHALCAYEEVTTVLKAVAVAVAAAVAAAAGGGVVVVVVVVVGLIHCYISCINRSQHG